MIDLYCGKCGLQLTLKKEGKIVYSTDLPGHVPFYRTVLYRCPNAMLPWGFSSHDQYETNKETPEYIRAKKRYDKTHHFPLPNAPSTIWKGL